MSKLAYIEVIKGDLSSRSLSRNELEDDLKKYPFMSSLHTLLAKKNKEESHDDFGSSLIRASLYANNRNKLKHFIEPILHSVSFTYSTEKVSDHTGVNTFHSYDHSSEEKDLPLASDPEEAIKSSQQKQIDQFLDTFGEEGKRISSAELSDDDNQEDLSIIEDSQDIVSENYAKILLKNNRKDEAIKIYQELILKFPEKSNYFAGVLEKLK